MNDDLLQKIDALIKPLREDISTIKTGQKQQRQEFTKRFDELGGEVNTLKSGQRRVETEVGQMKSTLEAVTAGGQTLATKADVQDMMEEIKKVKRRVENLEEETGTPNPYKH